jgi:dipeptidyl aminopeptidase/acylaminoacyl peptidase
MSNTPKTHSLAAALSAGLSIIAPAPLVAQTTYQKAPKAIQEVLNAPLTPQMIPSPSRQHALFISAERHPPVADYAQPYFGLAGTRVNPLTRGPHPTPTGKDLVLKRIADNRDVRPAFPAGVQLGGPRWSPDGQRYALTTTSARAIELWIGDLKGAVRKVPGLKLVGALGASFQWMPDGRTLLARAIPAGLGKAPEAPVVPAGPNVQESKGQAGPVRTFQDLLSNPHEEKLFEHFMTAQLVKVDAATLKTASYGKPGIFMGIDPAPDNRQVLVQRIVKPYSYLLTASAFPRAVEVWDAAGKVAKALPTMPAQDRVPIEGVPTGPRTYSWRPTEPATLYWVEALDEGDPRKKVPHRDKVMRWKAPFAGEAEEVLRVEHRIAGWTWGERDGLVLVGDYERDRRWSRTFLTRVDAPRRELKPVFSRSIQDRYNDPGTPVLRTLPNGFPVLHQQGDTIFLRGAGASPEGDRPFLDRFDLATLKAERIFRSGSDHYENVQALADEAGTRFLTWRESPSDPPNYFLREAAGSAKALTAYPDPAPILRGITKQLVKYKRPDGVDLSFTLYLPPGYQAGTRLPTVVWAYPQEFVDASAAGQVTGSTQRFTQVGGISHLFFPLQGYAVLDDAKMPVVGSAEKANDSFIEQITAGAKAAIDKATEMGVTDPRRVGVGGHSYGAFMTGNLLAHTDLFRAGIARSGAYNRTLTPFGFQGERRTLWEAPDTYTKLSPFMAAQKINEPLLLIHGEADNNPGTFPIQSDRLYQAVRGNGGTVRLVMLPHESHGYSARESVEHTLWEMVQWFDTHVKDAK